MMLYRYQPVAETTASDDEQDKYLRRVRQVVVESTLRLSSPLLFNDLFDHRVVVPQPTPEQHEIYLNKIVRERGAIEVAMGRRTVAELAAALQQHRDPMTAHAWAEKMCQDALNTMGVSCFSEYRDHILMWGYYANSHAGICFGFDTDRCPVLRATQKVNYAATPTVFDYFADFVPGRIIGSAERQREIVKLCVTKWDGWGHEAEWRLVTNEVPGDGMVAFAQGALTEIHLGSKMKDVVIQNVKDLIRETGRPIALYKVRPARDAFKLHFDAVPM